MTFHKQQECIKSYLYRFTKDKWLIDELCQIVSIKLYTSKLEKKTKGLIYTTVKSVYIDHYRKTHSKKSNTVIYEEWDCESELRPDDILVTKENKVALLKCIDELPEKQKEVVYLRYYCNLDFLKISEIMRCPFNTSLSHMHKAKKNLKILLTKNQ